MGSSGNVGIGTIAPDARLHVIGSFKLVDGTQTNGYVLTSNAAGLANWQAPSTGGDVYKASTQTFTGENTFYKTIYINAAIQSTGGNARGLSAVDLQTSRDAATQVASGDISVIGGGYDNTASALYSTVAGGIGNTASSGGAEFGWFAAVGGGASNTASARGATVSGGQNNTASKERTTVSGGYNNTASGTLATISGGQDNTVSGSTATVAGGIGNTASEGYTTVSGGKSNTASNYGATIAGGESNTASGVLATVSGGYQNNAGDNGTVAGGESNTAGGPAGTVSGGQNNTANGSFSVVSGGYQNNAANYGATVSGGLSNMADDTATVPGGAFNTALGQYSFAAGYLSSSTANGTFTWSDSEGTEVDNAVADRTWFKNKGGFLATASTNTADGGMFLNNSNYVGIGTLVPTSTLTVLGTFKLVDGTQTDGYVLTSNAAGLASWQAASGGDVYKASTQTFTGLNTFNNGVFFSSIIQSTGVGPTGIAGNSRGLNAVDLQTDRILVTQVASGQYSAIGGGQRNTASSSYSTVPGGYLNIASGSQSTAGGGNNNTANGMTSTIAGGSNNMAGSQYDTVSGGFNNWAKSPGSPKHAAAIAGGGQNVAIGGYAFVAGGQENTSKGDNTFSAGYKSSSTANGAFTWADSAGVVVDNNVADRTWFKNRGGFLISTAPVASAAAFAVDSTGKVGIGTLVPTSTLTVIGTFKLTDGSQGAGKVLTSDSVGLAAWAAPAGPVYAVTQANNTNATPTLADIPMLSIALLANATYQFEAELSCGAGATAVGLQYAVAYPAAGATLEAVIYGPVSSTAMMNSRITAINTATQNYLTEIVLTGGILIKGIITTSSSGNLTIQHAAPNPNQSTVYKGSYLKVTKL